MIPPAGYVSRPAGRDDLDRIVALFEAYDVWDFGRADFEPAHLLDDWSMPSFEAARDTWLVGAADGSPVGFAQITSEGPRSFESFGCVHPEHHGRGVGTFLLSRAEDGVRARAGPGGVMRTWTSARDSGAGSLLRSRGFDPVRRFFHMERPLGEEPVLEPPEGIQIRTFVRGRDDRELFDAKEEGFAGHFGYEPTTFEAWKERLAALPTFDPAGVFLARDGDAVVGLVDAFAAGGTGWIGELAVRPAWRGRRIGSALLLRGFAHLASRGLEQVRLNVDAGNETGAVALYERVGMQVRREWRVYEKPCAPDIS